VSAKRRVDQLLSSLGYCSRKQAQQWCDEERVVADGAPMRRASEKVDAAAVQVDGEALDFPDGLLLLMHKPVGVVCSHEPSEGRRVYDLLPPRLLLRDPRVVTVGRLDKDTSGVLLVTDRGALVQRFTSPKHKVEKVYEATVEGELSQDTVAAFARGIQLEGEDAPCAPAALRVVDAAHAEVTMTEGKYHQVRRMFAACGLYVTALHRSRFGEWTVEGLAPGEWRALPLD